jgi:glycosyltransferase involved in cell wall biosynthesis
VSRQLVDEIEDDRDVVVGTAGDVGIGIHTDHTFEIAYLGSMGTANSLAPVVDAFCVAADRLVGRRLVLRLVGTGPDRRRLEERAAASGHASRIVFEGHLPQSEARAVGRRADALIANLRPLDLYRHGTSLNKFFEYLLLAKPVVLGASVPRDPITDSGAGVRVPGDDVPALADAICRVATMRAPDRLELGARGRRHVLAHYDYDVLVVRLAAALDAAMAMAISPAPPRRPGTGR